MFRRQTQCHRLVEFILLLQLFALEGFSFTNDFRNVVLFDSSRMHLNQQRRRQATTLEQIKTTDQFHRAYCSIADDDDSVFQLPIFPLKKAVKLPTEDISLNLFEDRYLKMARHVLREQQHHPQQQTCCYFGALYCAGKPQIIRDAMGPITPLVEIGDVGVIFLVVENDEGLIPSLDGNLRRRIRLRGVAIGRFRIEAVRQNGFESDSAFILVDATKVKDKMINAASEEAVVANLASDLRRIIKLQMESIENSNVRPKVIGDDEDTSDVNFSINNNNRLAAAIVQDQQYLTDSLLSEEQDDKGLVGASHTLYLRELFSFFAISQLRGLDAAPTDILRCLQSVSTKDRLLFASQLHAKNQLWKFPF